MAAEDNFEKLSALRPVKGANGQPYMDSGNFAVVFKMTDGKKDYAVKCFIKDQPGRAEAYRKVTSALRCVRSDYLIEAEYLEKELYVYMGGRGEEEFPVLKMDWVEGKRLDDYLRSADARAKSLLVDEYSRMVCWLLHQPFAHGDLKPDNIIVRGDGSIVLLDYDGMFVPSMRGEKPREVGTKPYCHPLRTVETFDAHIDDYAAVLIALLLRAVALDPSLDYDELLREVGKPTFFEQFGRMVGDARMSFLLAAYHVVLEYGAIDARMADVLLTYGGDIEMSRRMTSGIPMPEEPVIKTPPPGKKTVVRAAANTINGHEWVDLGLSVKWATCNIGAERPEDYGNYYAWGETRTKDDYSRSNCETWGKAIGDIGGTSRDVAHVKWGGSWRMPTKAEIDELIENCDYKWTSVNVVEGGKFTSRKNGKSIFLPAAGGRTWLPPFGFNKYGDYWSSTPCEYSTQRASSLGLRGSDLNLLPMTLGSSSHDRDWRRNSCGGYDNYRSDGYPVRPVSE